MKRGGRPNQMSAKRRAQMVVRRQVVAVVAARAGGGCWWRPVITEIRCGALPGRGSHEVDELRGGSWRNVEWLDPDACRLICPKHHEWKTDHKLEALARLAHYEETHPWPSTPSLPND